MIRHWLTVSPPFRDPSARYVAESKLSFRNVTLPSPYAKLTPPGWKLPNGISLQDIVFGVVEDTVGRSPP